MKPDIGGIGMTSQRTRERLVQRLIDQGVSNISVLNAIRTTPRHLFLDEAMSHRAYEDTALPIGFNQTLSQPYIVARMTELLLRDGRPEKVLEIGSGSGYQTSLLAQLVDQVYAVERIKPLLDKSRKILRQLKYRNVMFQHSDGSLERHSYAPFDAILCAAAPVSIPDVFLEQLMPDGRLILPVGKESQVLKMITRKADEFVTETFETVRFVPLCEGTVR
mgnify:FL=1